MPGIDTSGKLKKVSIQAYKKSDYKSKATISNTKSDLTRSGKFEALLNPTSYSESFEINLNDDTALGDTGGQQRFVNSKSSNLKLQFLFDGTGVVQENSGLKLLNTFKRNEFKVLTVSEQLSDFKKVTFDYEGDIHQPYYLEIKWGSLIYRGRLKSMKVGYTLFNAEGEPLRATVDTEFVQFTDQERRAADAKNSSPDLSHYRVVKAGDTLPLLTEEIYGDSKYYLEVAKINGITNFRRLKVGTQITFPPIEKTAN